MRLLLAVAVAVSLVGCAHAPAPVAVAVEPKAEAPAQPWACTADGVCHRGEVSEHAVVVPPPVSDAEAGKEGWTEVSPGMPAQPTDWYKQLSPSAKLVADFAAAVAHGAR